MQGLNTIEQREELKNASPRIQPLNLELIIGYI